MSKDIKIKSFFGVLLIFIALIGLVLLVFPLTRATIFAVLLSVTVVRALSMISLLIETSYQNWSDKHFTYLLKLPYYTILISLLFYLSP